VTFAAEAFQLADELTLPTPSIDLALVVARSQVLVVSLGVGEKMPDDREH
jgi:hypothetical protein